MCKKHLFSENITTEAKGNIVQIPLSKLHSFHSHPFRVMDGPEMDQIIDSIKQFGIITPLIARPHPQDGYEVISGHRRIAACQHLGIKTLPVLIRDMDDDQAVIAMVDANLQREHILPSEKAFAYKMKCDALRHQGKASPQFGEKLLTAENVGRTLGDSKNQVLRYVRLTYLVPDLLSLVDEKRIAFNPAVEISFIKQEEQNMLLDAIWEYDCTPSLSQSIQMKKLSRNNLLTMDQIRAILSELKPNQQPRLTLNREDLSKFFSRQCTDEQIKQDILKGLELLHLKRLADFSQP